MDSEDKIILKVSPSQWQHWLLYGTTVCATSASATLAVLGVSFSLVALGASILLVLYSLSQWIKTASVSILITSELISISSGIANRRTEEIELYRIRNREYFQSPVMRLLDLQTVVWFTDVPNDPILRMPWIPFNEESNNHVRHAVDECRRLNNVRSVEVADFSGR